MSPLHIIYNNLSFCTLKVHTVYFPVASVILRSFMLRMRGFLYLSYIKSPCVCQMLTHEQGQIRHSETDIQRGHAFVVCLVLLVWLLQLLSFVMEEGACWFLEKVRLLSNCKAFTENLCASSTMAGQDGFQTEILRSLT